MIKRFIHILGGKFAVLLLGIAITPVLVRILGSELYGDYAFLISTLGLIMIVVNAGIFDGTRKFISEEHEENQLWEHHVIGFYGFISLILAIVASFVIWGLVFFGIIEAWLGPSFELYFLILALLVVFRQATSFLRSCLMGFGDERYSEPIEAIKKAIYGISGLTLAYVGYDIVGILIGHVLAALIGTSVAVLYLRRHITSWRAIYRIPPDFPKRELLGFNMFSVILIFLTSSLYHVDILLLRTIVGSEQTGLYKASLVVAEFLWFVPLAVQILLLHSTSEMWSKNQVEAIEETAGRTTRYTLSFTLLVAIGIAALAEPFVLLYFGSDFSDAVLPLLFLLPGALCFAIARPIFAIGQGKGNLRVLILATGSAALLNLVLNIMLIPRFGMYGAGVATSIGYGLMIILHVLAARRIGFNPLVDVRIMRISLVAIITGPIIFVAAFVLPSYIGLIFVPPFGFIIYTYLTIQFGVIDTAELIEILEIAPDPIRKMVLKMTA